MSGHRRAIVAFVAFLVAGAVACGARTDLLENDAAAPLPPVTLTPPTRAVMAECDGGATLVYVVTDKNGLLSFNPPAASFVLIGQLSCPVTIGSNAGPFSMAVDRSGTAYVLFGTPDHGRSELFRVSLATAACRATGFVSPPDFTTTFGMGYSTDVVDGGETLYVASNEMTGSRLAALDTSTFTLDVIGPLDAPIATPELAGTGGGDLFAFWGDKEGSTIAQIDKSSAHSVGQSRLPGVFPIAAWAFVIWGGDFYTFTSPTDTDGSVVTRFRPADGSIVQVAQFPDEIVGAGVSTCAPLR